MCFATRKTALLSLPKPETGGVEGILPIKSAQQHVCRVELQQSQRNVGGRPAKKEHERASVKLNCWVTTQEKELLWGEYLKMKAGRRLAFAVYLKQKLLAKRSTSTTKTDDLLLTILINLQERGRQLEYISKTIQSEAVPDNADVTGEIRVELKAIEETLTRISEWLYES